MRTALEKAAVRLEILTGRLRACGQHELMDEAEMFVYEARRALASAPATEAGGRVNWQAIAERRKNVIEGLFAALERIKAVSHRGAYGQRYLQHDASQMAEIAQEAYDTAMASAVDILRSIDERRALTAPVDARPDPAADLCMKPDCRNPNCDQHGIHAWPDRRESAAPADAREAGREIADVTDDDSLYDWFGPRRRAAMAVIEAAQTYITDAHLLNFLALEKALDALNADARPETGEPAS